MNGGLWLCCGTLALCARCFRCDRKSVGGLHSCAHALERTHAHTSRAHGQRRAIGFKIYNLIRLLIKMYDV